MGVRNLGSPDPCVRAQPFQTLPPGEGMGKPGFPIPLLKRQSVATKVTAPLPSPPPAGGRESGASPQRGEVGRGAGAPHALRWKGLALVAYVHISRPCSYAAHKQKIGSSLEGCALPDPPAGGGVGKPGFPTPLGPMFTLAVHAATPHTNRMKIGSSLEGCVLPNPPAGGGWGNLVPPYPCVRARPARGRGRGKTRFLQTPARGQRSPKPSRGWGRGEPGFPPTPA